MSLRVAWLLCFAALAQSASAQSVSRSEALRIAESYVFHRWQSSAKNLFHGKDAKGIEVHTPDCGGGRGHPRAECWQVDAVNIGIAYKWGGNDTPASFDAGISAGKAAGDVYTLAKRRLDEAGTSDGAVGIDCSAFICRCWKTPSRYSTTSLKEICRRLSSPAQMRPADIMNQSHGHVLMFVRWLDADKKRALFYEAAPFSKTRASVQEVGELAARGFVPLRYRYIRG